MQIKNAPSAVRAAIHSLVAGQMAATLLIHRADLRDRTACRVALLQNGFGETSVDALLTNAIEAAARSLVEAETGA